MALVAIKAGGAFSTRDGSCVRGVAGQLTMDLLGAYYDDVNTARYVTFTPGAGIPVQDVYLALRIASYAAGATVTVTLEENTGAWQVRQSNAVAVNRANFPSSVSLGLFTFDSFHTTTANQYRIGVSCSVSGRVYWVRSSAAGAYEYGVFRNDVTAKPGATDTAILDKRQTLTVDCNVTLAPTNVRSLVIGDAATLTSDGLGEHTLDLGAGTIHQGASGVISIGTEAARNSKASKFTISTSAPLGSTLFGPAINGTYGGADANIETNILRLYGEPSSALEMILATDAPAGQNVVDMVAPIPSTFADGDLVTFVAKDQANTDNVTYYAKKTGDRQIALFTTAGATIRLNLNTTCLAGGKCINLTRADDLGIKITSVNHVSLWYSALDHVKIKGVYLTNASVGNFGMSAVSTALSELDCIVVTANYNAAFINLSFSGTPLSGHTVKNFYYVNSTSSSGGITFAGSGFVCDKGAIRGIGAYSTGSSGLDHSWSNFVFGQPSSDYRYFGLRYTSGSGLSLTDCFFIGTGLCLIAMSNPTFNNVKQQRSAGSGLDCVDRAGSASVSVVGLTGGNNRFGVGNSNGIADIYVGTNALVQGVLDSSAFGGSGISNMANAAPRSYLGVHNYNAVPGDHKTWKPFANFSTDIVPASLIMSQVNVADVAEHRFAVLSEAISAQELSVVAKGQMGGAYGEATQPRIDVFADGGAAPIATVALADGAAAQVVRAGFTPTTDNAQVVVAFRTAFTVQGRTATWSNARIVRRQWGFVFEEFAIPITETLTYPVGTITTRRANPFITLTEAQAGALTGLSYDGATIRQTENQTVLEVYQWFQWWAMQDPTRAVPFDTADGVNFTCAANYTLDGCTLSGNGSQKIIHMEAYTYDRLNGGVADGVVFVDAAGTHVTIALSGPAVGSTVQVYDETDAAELYLGVVASPTLVLDALYTGADHSVRIRVRKATYLPWETTASVGANGLTLPVNQTANSIYADTGIDGSTVTEFRFVGSQIKVFLDDADGYTTVQRLIAWYLASIASTQFIGIQPADLNCPSAQWAQLLNGMQVKNVGARPVVISGGNITDAGNDPASIVDTAGGAIYIVSAMPSANVSDMAAAVWASPAYVAPDNAGIAAIRAKTDALPPVVRRGAALSLPFPMKTAAGLLVRGVPVASLISKDCGPQAGTSNSVREIGGGLYALDLTAAEMAAAAVAVVFTATGAAPLTLTILTQ